MNKKLIVLGLLAVALTANFSSCKKKSTSTTTTNTDKEIIYVEVPFTKTKTMPDSIAPIPVKIPYPGLGILKDTFATKVDEMLLTYGPPGLTKDKIIKIEPMEFSASIDNTTTQTFDFIDDSVNVFLDKYQGTTPIKVATAHGISQGAKSVTFNCISTDIKDLFYNDFLEFNLEFGTPANSGLEKNSVFITNIKFKITAYKP